MIKTFRLFTALLLIVFISISGFSANFIVNVTGDAGDSNPGDGVCNNGTGNCTLRAAIQEANALAGSDVITFDALLNGSTITIGSVLIIDPLDGIFTNIIGPGANQLTIDGGGTSQLFSIKYGVITDLTLTNGNDGAAVPVIGINGTSNAILAGLKITNNILDNGMPTVQMNSTGTLDIFNTLIADNGGGANNGAGFKMAGGTTNITNSTIARNTALYGGGGIRQDGGTLNLANSIVALNDGGCCPDDIQFNAGTFNANAPNLIGDNSGSGLISDGILIGDGITPVDPQFTNAPGGDYTVLVTSPANDAGNDANAPPTPYLTDADGGDRIQGAMVDLGAFEILALPIPTLSQWGTIVLCIGLFVLGIVAVRQKVVLVS